MKIECTEASSGLWSWRFKTDNGSATIAEGVKTFDSQEAAQKAIEQFADALGVNKDDVSYVPLNPEPEPQQQQQEEEEK